LTLLSAFWLKVKIFFFICVTKKLNKLKKKKHIAQKKKKTFKNATDFTVTKKEKNGITTTYGD